MRSGHRGCERSRARLADDGIAYSHPAPRVRTVDDACRARRVITLAAFVGYVNEVIDRAPPADGRHEPTGCGALQVTIRLVNDRLAGHFADDKDHGRTISRVDFFGLCRRERLPRKRVTWLWESLDLNGDGQLDFTEFRNFLGQKFLPVALSEDFRPAERRTAHAPR